MGGMAKSDEVESGLKFKRVNWQRLRLRIHRVIGRVTKNYSLENRLIMEIWEEKDVSNK